MTRSVDFSDPSACLFSTDRGMGLGEGCQNQLVNVKNTNIPPHNMSWEF